jgi:hypothetical protein
MHGRICSARQQARNAALTGCPAVISADQNARQGLQATAMLCSHAGLLVLCRGICDQGAHCWTCHVACLSNDLHLNEHATLVPGFAGQCDAESDMLPTAQLAQTSCTVFKIAFALNSRRYQHTAFCRAH